MKPEFIVEQQLKHNQKRVWLPSEMSEDLAEIVGIHFGDGNMSLYNYTYRISYSIGKVDHQYARYICELFAKTLRIRLRVYDDKHRNAFILSFMSKSICEFFNKSLGIPYGPKRNLHIPQIIKSNPLLLARFLRGLFDTDGCVIKQKQGKYRYVLLRIATGQTAFAEEIKEAFTLLSIRSYICRKAPGFDVTIRRKADRDRFMALIGSQNERKRARAEAPAAMGTPRFERGFAGITIPERDIPCG